MSRPQLDAEVVAAWNGWKGRLPRAGRHRARRPSPLPGQVRAAASSKTVSEGQGYGLLLAVLLAGADGQAQQIFDGLWSFALDHPSTIDARLMDWSVPADERSIPTATTRPSTATPTSPWPS